MFRAWRYLAEFWLSTRELRPMVALYLAVVTVCCLLVVGGEWFFRPTPAAEPIDSTPWMRRAAEESATLRWENYRLRGELADRDARLVELELLLDSARRQAARQPQHEQPDPAPVDLIPPQQLPLPSRQP